MTPSGLEQRGYLVVAMDAGIADPEVEAALLALIAQGWRLRLEGFGLRVLSGPRCPWPVAQVHRRHLLIGHWCGEGLHPSAIAGRRGGGETLGRELMSEGWGAYLMIWADPGGRLNIVRDPTGAIDAVWWRRRGAIFITDHPPEALNSLLPKDLAIDWARLGDILSHPAALTDGLALKGFNPIPAGAWVETDSQGAQVQLWRPAEHAQRLASDAPEALCETVDVVVRRLMRGRSHIVAELSGGLDSAVVAGSLVATGHADQARFINYYSDDVEGDERIYAQAAADVGRFALETVRKPVAPITEADLAPLGLGLRPALQGVDVAYDREAAQRLGAINADGLMTGQGGDSVFFHAPDPRVAADRFQREGLRALAPPYLAAVGRWTRHSAWTVAGIALRSHAKTGAEFGHPWLNGAQDLPPAKHGQLRRLISNQLFWTDCLRARAAPLLNPLLSQPVVEHCLGVPTDRLTLGPRDRGLARMAFASRLPDLIRERRSKGDLSRFYGHVIRDSLPALQALLPDGRLVAHGVLAEEDLGRDLDRDRLLWSEGSNQPLLAAVLETWVRHWERRIARRRTEVAP